MEHFVVDLKEIYPFLGEDGREPKLEAFIRRSFTAKNQKNPNRPAILILPGGGYSFTTVRETDAVALPFLTDGFNTFILSYSVAPHHDPAQIIEVAAAMDMIRKNAEAWHVDGDKIAVLGFSAGGHLSAYYANRFDCDAVIKHFPDSRGPNASVLCYPVLTADREYTHSGCLENLIGHKNSTEEERQSFSCEKMVSKRTPPTFLWTTRTDHVVSPMNCLLYAEALTKNDVPYSLHIYPTGKHSLVTADEQTNLPETLANGASLAHSWLAEASAWLKLTFEIGA